MKMKFKAIRIFGLMITTKNQIEKAKFIFDSEDINDLINLKNEVNNKEME